VPGAGGGLVAGLTGDFEASQFFASGEGLLNPTRTSAFAGPGLPGYGVAESGRILWADCSFAARLDGDGFDAAKDVDGTQPISRRQLPDMGNDLLSLPLSLPVGVMRAWLGLQGWVCRV